MSHKQLFNRVGRLILVMLLLLQFTLPLFGSTPSFAATSPVPERENSATNAPVTPPSEKPQTMEDVVNNIGYIDPNIRTPKKGKYNLRGGIMQVGNSLGLAMEKGAVYTVSGVAQYVDSIGCYTTLEYAGTGGFPPSGPNNPDGCYNRNYDANVDPPAHAIPNATNTFNLQSSLARLTVPAGSTIVEATLYYYGTYLNDAIGEGRDANLAPYTQSYNNAVKFWYPGRAYTSGGGNYDLLTASRIYVYRDPNVTQEFYHFMGKVDVTNIVSSRRNGDYAVGGVHCKISNYPGGLSGRAGPTENQACGWQLIVVYNNPAEPYRNVTIFEGLDGNNRSQNTFTVGGFVTPATGAFNSKFGFASFDGDPSVVDNYTMRTNVQGADLRFCNAVNPPTPANDQTAVNPVNGQTSTIAGPCNDNANSIISNDRGQQASNNSGAGDFYYPNHVTQSGITLAQAQNPYGAGTGWYYNGAGGQLYGFDLKTYPLDGTYANNNGTPITGQSYLGNAATVAFLTSSSPGTGGSVDRVPYGTQWLQVDVQFPSPTIEKTADRTQAAPGDFINYSVTIRNPSAQRAENVYLFDRLPANTTFVAGSVNVTGSNAQIVPATPASNPFATGNPNGLLVANSIEGNGGSVTITYRLQVNNGTPSGTQIINCAEVPTGGFTFTLPNGEVVVSDSTVGPACTTVTVVAPPSFSANKTVSPASGPYRPGQTLTFNIAVTNSGGSTGSTSVADTLNANLTFVAGSISLNPAGAGTVNTGYNGSSNNVLATVNVAAGQTVTVSFQATINSFGSGAQACTDRTITNTASLLVPNTTTVLATASSPAIVAGAPDLRVNKTVAGQRGPGNNTGPGDNVTYTITVSNASTSVSANNVTVTDVVDANLGTPSNISNGGSFNAGNRIITWTVPTIAAGGQVTLTFQATVASGLAQGTVINNQVNATPSQSEGGCPGTGGVALTYSTPNLTTSSKTVDRTQVRPGETITYTITLINSGTQDATNLTVSDPLDALLTNPTNISNGGTFAGGIITWTGLNVPAGGQLVLTFRAQVVSTAVDNSTINNRATITFPPSTGIPPITEDAPPVIVRFPTLTQSKTVDKTLVRPGELLVYTIRVNNESASNTPATGVTITDVLDSNLVVPPTFISGGGTFDNANRRITWLNQTVTPGAPLMLTFTVQVAPTTPAGTIIRNTAVVNPPIERPGLPPVDAPAPDVLVNFPVINAAKSVDKTTVQPGDTVLYTIRITNTNTTMAATNITITDTLDPLLENPVNISNNGTVNGTTITWNIATIPPLGLVTLSFQATVKSTAQDAQIINNTATVEPPTECLNNPQCNTPDQPKAPPVTVRRPEYRLALLKGGAMVVDNNNNNQINLGDVVEFTLRATNTGNRPLVNLALTDTYGELISYQSVQIPALKGSRYVGNSATASYTPTATTNPAQAVQVAAQPADGANQGQLKITANNLQVNQSILITFKVRIDTNVAELVQDPNFPNNPLKKTLWNRAVITAYPEGGGTQIQTQSDDAKTPELDDPTRVPVDAPDNADLAIVKTVDKAQVTPGQQLNYSLVVTNNGPITATNVVVTDTLPANTTFVSASPNPQSNTNGVLTWNLGNLNVSETRTIQVTVLVPANYTADTVTNVAETRSDTPDPNPDNNRDTETTTVAGSQADVSILKTGPQTTAIGNQVSYRLFINNAGPNTAVGTLVTDTMPLGMTFVSSNPNPKTIDAPNRKVIWDLGNLAPNENRTIDVVVLVESNATSPLTNYARVDSRTPDPNPNNNESSTVTTFSAPPPQGTPLPTLTPIPNGTPIPTPTPIVQPSPTPPPLPAVTGGNLYAMLRVAKPIFEKAGITLTIPESLRYVAYSEDEIDFGGVIMFMFAGVLLAGLVVSMYWTRRIKKVGK